MNSDNNKEFIGFNGTLILTETGVIIKRGVRGFLLGGGMLRGDKTIPYGSIIAIQFKKAGLVAGYIQLTLRGGSEPKNGLLQSIVDENTVNFQTGGNVIFEEAKKLIEEKISTISSSSLQNNKFDDLEKLADLKKKDIITEDEFNAKKKEILGL